MKKKKILFAAVDIGFRIELYSKFIHTHLSDQLQPESFTKFKLAESHYKTSYDYVCAVDKHSKVYVYLYTFFFFLYSLFRFDVFHFFSGETLLTRKLRRFEFKMYKLFGKRIVMHFVGSDIRSPEYLFWKDKNLMEFLNGNRGFPLILPWQDDLIKDTMDFADKILVSTPDLLAIIPTAKYYPVLIDFDKFVRESGGLSISRHGDTNDKKYTILHSPSNARVKGTKFIHDALEEMKEEFGEEVETITPGIRILNSKKLYSVSRYELFELLKKSDVLIDQLVIGWYGLQSMEALLSGELVLCYLESGLEQYLYPGCPVINVNAITLKETLTKLINEKKRYTATEIDANIAWVKKYHTIENNHEPLLEAWGIDRKSVGVS